MRVHQLCSVVSVSVLMAAHAEAAPVYYGFSSASSHAVTNAGPGDFEEFNGVVPINAISYSGVNAAGIVEPYGAWSADGQGTGTANVNAGGIHLTAHGSGTVINALGFIGANGSGYATGRFKDTFVLTVPNCGAMALCGTGAVGSLKAAVQVNGALSANGSVNSASNNGGWNASANWAASVALIAVGTGSAGWSGGQKYEAWPDGNALSGFNIAYPFAPFGSYTINLPVIFGNAVSVDIFGVVGAFGLAGAGSSPTNASGGGSANLGSTIAWGGILELRDAEGNPIVDFAALSLDTGFDYRSAYAAVPLPAGILLFAAGLSFLTATQLRRKNKPDL